MRAAHLGQPEIVVAAYAATVRSTIAILAVLNEQIAAMAKQVQTHFGQHPAAEIILSQPGLGPILGARVLAEFGDADDRYVTAKTRKNYAGTSPITRASGKKKVVIARSVHNDRLIDALDSQAFAALTASPGARAYYDRIRAREVSHRAALRQLANRLSASCTAVSKPGPTTTKQSPGHTTPKPSRLDFQAPGMSVSPAPQAARR